MVAPLEREMKEPIRVLRAHHIFSDLFSYYVKEGVMLDRFFYDSLKGNPEIEYPVTVVDYIDDFCVQCRPGVEINLCRGPLLKDFDHVIAQKFGLVFGLAYLREFLGKRFSEKMGEFGISRGSYGTDQLYEKVLNFNELEKFERYV